MQSITIAASAKINLSLLILSQRPDGYHEIETLMAQITLADEIEVSRGVESGIQFACNVPELPAGSENLCVKAACAFFQASGIEHGIAISLMKRIPHGAGLGGGSSDAASVLKGLNELFDHPLVQEELHQIGATLGSDVPFFLENGPIWCRGRGEILEPSTPLPERRILLIKPPYPVATSWAYMHFAELKNNASTPKAEVPQYLGDIKLTNDLEFPVFHKHLILHVMKSWFRSRPGVESAFMTGSGSTMVAILAPSVSDQDITVLRRQIAVEFGPTFWVTETAFRAV